MILCLRSASDKATAGLEAIAWETLFDGEDFLAAGAKTGLSRLPYDMAPPDDCQAISPPLTMLAFVASPLDLQDPERLPIEREQEILLSAVNTTAGQGKLTAKFEDEAKLTVLARLLSQLSLLRIFDYFENQLSITPEAGAPGGNADGGSRNSQSVTSQDCRLKIGDDNLRIFLQTLIKAIKAKTRFISTGRYLFELDEKRVGTVQELARRDLRRPEALGLMQKLPPLSISAYAEKLKASEVFGGLSYALIALDRPCGFGPLAKILQDASAVHVELRQFLAIKLSAVVEASPRVGGSAGCVSDTGTGRGGGVGWWHCCAVGWVK